MRSIRRYVIPIDGQAHQFRMCYDPLHASRGLMKDELYFWAEHDDDTGEYTVTLQVFDTGVPVPDNALWLATVLKTSSGEAWHLMNVTVPVESDLGGYSS
jgi:hypothetical protein